MTNIIPNCKCELNPLMSEVSRYYYECPKCGERFPTGVFFNFWGKPVDVRAMLEKRAS